MTREKPRNSNSRICIFARHALRDEVGFHFLGAYPLFATSSKQTTCKQRDRQVLDTYVYECKALNKKTDWSVGMRVLLHSNMVRRIGRVIAALAYDAARLLAHSAQEHKLLRPGSLRAGWPTLRLARCTGQKSASREACILSMRVCAVSSHCSIALLVLVE